MKQTLLSSNQITAITAPVAKVISCGFEEYVVLPIQEPWASMIADGIKPYEFRCWLSKWAIGKKILIVATGKAKSPREIIAIATNGGTDIVVPSPANKDEYLFHDLLTTQEDLNKWGGALFDNAIWLKNVTRFKEPIPLSKLGIMRTPQKYQYWKGDIDNFTKWNVNK